MEFDRLKEILWAELSVLIEAEIDAQSARDLPRLKKLDERKRALQEAIEVEDLDKTVKLLWGQAAFLADRVAQVCREDRQYASFSPAMEELSYYDYLLAKIEAPAQEAAVEDEVPGRQLTLVPTSPPPQPHPLVEGKTKGGGDTATSRAVAKQVEHRNRFVMGDEIFLVVQTVLFEDYETQVKACKALWPDRFRSNPTTAQANFSQYKKRGLETVFLVLEQPDLRKLDLPFEQLQFYVKVLEVFGEQNTKERIKEKAQANLGRRTSRPTGGTSETTPAQTAAETPLPSERALPASSSTSPLIPLTSRASGNNGTGSPTEAVLEREPLAGFMSPEHEKILRAALLHPDGATIDVSIISERSGIVRGAVEPLLKGAIKALQEVLNAKDSGRQLTVEAEEIVQAVRERWPSEQHVDGITRHLYRESNSPTHERARL